MKDTGAETEMGRRRNRCFGPLQGGLDVCVCICDQKHKNRTQFFHNMLIVFVFNT